MALAQVVHVFPRPVFTCAGDKFVDPMSIVSYETYEATLTSVSEALHKGMEADPKLVNSLVLAYLEKCGEAAACKDLRKRLKTKRVPKGFATLEFIVTAFVRAQEVGKKGEAKKRKLDVNDSSAPKKAKTTHDVSSSGTEESGNGKEQEDSSDSSDEEEMETDQKKPEAATNGGKVMTKIAKKESSSEEESDSSEDDTPPAKKMKPVAVLRVFQL